MFFTNCSKRFALFVPALFLGTLLILGGVAVSAIDTRYARAQESTAPATSDGTAVAERRAELQRQLDALEREIAETQGELDGLRSEGQSIQRDINILDADIKRAQLQIRATQVQIQALDQNIVIHSRTIGALSTQLESERAAVAQILRKTDQIDDYSLVEVVLSAQNVSSFFGDLDSFVAIKQALADSSEQLATTREATETQKDALENQRTEQERLREIQRAAQARIERQQAEKRQLLAQNRSQAAQVQSVVAAKQKTAGEIRAELFAVAGGGGQIPLPVAIQLAKQAGSAAGVRPALILAILKQETDLGRNVGQCLLTNDPAKGDGKGRNTGTPFARVMKPDRDVDPFIAVTQKNGLDWQTQPVSCPMSYGYGGAMGPSQFIPSTWVLYEARVARAHGVSVANPWNNLHAFTATAMLLADNGATAGTRESERLAALRYYAGWGGATNPAYSFYGDGVMRFADQFQADINTLGGN